MLIQSIKTSFDENTGIADFVYLIEFLLLFYAKLAIFER